MTFRAVLMFAAAALALPAQSELQRRFIGAWDLVSYQVRTPAGQDTRPLGKDPAGRISYDAQGHISAHLVGRGVPAFRAASRADATTEEMVAAWRGYVGYFGRYTIDEKAGVVIHSVEGSWYPNYVGTKQVRHYRFAGDRLTLEADTPLGHHTVVWQRSR